MRGSTIRSYLAMGLMGFGSGLPLLMVSTTLAIFSSPGTYAAGKVRYENAL